VPMKAMIALAMVMSISPLSRTTIRSLLTSLMSLIWDLLSLTLKVRDLSAALLNLSKTPIQLLTVPSSASVMIERLSPLKSPLLISWNTGMNKHYSQVKKVRLKLYQLNPIKLLNTSLITHQLSLSFQTLSLLKPTLALQAVRVAIKNAPRTPR
jgi:hypothetical protein